jgi:single-strand DNA-binding protein
MLPQINGEFRVVADPELRFAPSGTPVASMRVVANSRKKNDAGEWVDDKVCWLRVVAFNRLAENIAESLTQGALIVVEGRLQTEQWEDRETHEKKSSYTIMADRVGPSLAFKGARILEAERQQGQQQQSSSGGGVSAPTEDPWGTPPPQGDEPPF